MSTGQIAGGIVGGVVGYLSFGTSWALAGSLYSSTLLGAQYGSVVGGILLPKSQPGTSGPRLTDTSVQTSTYGANIPRIYGTCAVAGNVFWLEGDRLREKKKKSSGGKGGGGSSTTTYAYFATFATGLCMVSEGQEVLGIKRLWIGSNLVYDGSSASVSGIIKSKKQKAYWTLYTGADDQAPSPRMQADKGVDNVSAHPGLCYLVFEDLPLEKYGNSLAGAQVKAEIVVAGSQSTCPYGAPLVSSLPVAASSSEILSLAYANGKLRVSAGGAVRMFTLDGVEIGTEVHPGNYTGGDGNSYTPSYTAHNDPDSGWVTRYNSLYGQTWIALMDKGVVVPQTWGQGFGRSSVRIGKRLFGASNPDGLPIADILWAVEGGVVVAALELPASEVHYGLTTDDEFLYVTTSVGTTEYTADLVQTGFWAGIKLGDISHGGLAMCAISHRRLYGATDVLPCAVYTLNDDGTYTQSCVGGTCPAVRPSGQEFWWSKSHFYSPTAPISATDVQLSEIVRAECLRSNLMTAGDLDVTNLAADYVHGYRIASTAPIRSGIEALQKAWPFDIRMHGYTIQFVRRGQASVATIPADSLDARPGGEAPRPLLTIPREMDTQLPQRMVFRHLDASREYDFGEQPAQRYNTDAVNVVETDVPIVLTATEAARAAEVLLYAAWRERDGDITFRLPPAYLHLEPADVIGVVDSAGTTHTLRLNAIHYTADGTLECSARVEAPSAWSSTAVADSGESAGVPLVDDGPTLATLMALPAVTSGGNAPGFYAALCGISSTWPGGTLFGSSDAGQTWSELQSDDVGSVMGGVDTPLGAATCFDRVDAAGSLTFLPYAGTLESVSELQMLAGANHFAYGADGRWEILAARTATLNGDGTYTLRDFLRGRFGTEQHAATHAAGDRIVLLDSASTLFIALNANAIGIPGVYRQATFGASIDDETDIALTYSGENLKPRSPIQLNGSRHPTTNDWTLTWVRRARINTEWRDLVDVPLDEASEAYEVEIYASNAYATVKRTLTGLAAATAAYTSAQQVTDFGSNQATLYLKVYQLSATVGRGHPIIATITR